MKPKYHTIEQMIEEIYEPNRSACRQILADNRELFKAAQGSINNHQSWPGGYFDHVQECMNIAMVLFRRLHSIRPLSFSLSDLLLVLFLHDIEKPWKYEIRNGSICYRDDMKHKEGCRQFRVTKIAEYGVVLTLEQENGIKYIEIERDDYSNRQRAMGPLACVAHMCDVASARLWFDHPLEKDDSWDGAKRISS